jgi:structure-specific endonuclease subunit SLX1
MYVEKRIKQHNGVLAGGAAYTRKSRPWEIKIIVRGFDTWREALQFEWRWKKVRKKYGRVSPFERRKQCLTTLLSWKPWKEKTLQVEYL